MALRMKLVLGAVAVAAVGVVSVGAVVLMLRGEPVVEEVVVPVASTERLPLAVFTRPEGEPLEIFGPTCYEDGRGNDTILSDLPVAQTDCFVFRAGGQDLIDLSGRDADAPVLIAIDAMSPARQTIRLGPADDYIEVQGAFNVTLSGVAGQNSVLSLPGVSASDLRFRQEGQDVVLMTPGGSITLRDQAAGSGLEGPIANVMLRNDVVLRRSQIQVQSVVGQGTPGNDRIVSTLSDDIIFPGAGNDTISLLGGNNRIHFESGNDQIVVSGDSQGFNTLFIDFDRADVMLDPFNNNRDLVLTMPTGTVTLSLQLFHPIGDPRVPIQRVVFRDGPVTDEELRFLVEVDREERSQGAVEDRMRVRQ